MRIPEDRFEAADRILEEALDLRQDLARLTGDVLIRVVGDLSGQEDQTAVHRGLAHAWTGFVMRDRHLASLLFGIDR